MKVRKTIFTSLLIVLFACTPVFADINLSVNNQDIDANGDYLLNNSITFVEAKLINTITGAEVYLDNNQVNIVKNNDKLELTLDQNQALFNGQTLDLAATPYLKGDKVMLPLRQVAEALGAKVGWNADTRTVDLTYSETKNGLNAEELLVKSSIIANEMPTYDMDGKMKMHMTMSGIEEEGFPMEMVMNSDFYAHYEKDPLVVYTKQVMKMDELEDLPEGLEQMEVEAVLIEDAYYINTPEIGWIKMDLGGMSFNELMQMANTQDPTTMLKQMQDFGLMPTLANDVEIEGQKYYVINVAIDKEKFMEEYKNILNTLPLPDLADLDDVFNDLVNKMIFDINYTTYINHSTFMSDYMDMNMVMKMSIPSPEENSTETLEMKINMDARFNMKEADPDFKLPDISSAQELEIPNI